jgi:hypothetical protein
MTAASGHDTTGTLTSPRSPVGEGGDQQHRQDVVAAADDGWRKEPGIGREQRRACRRDQHEQDAAPKPILAHPASSFLF